MLTRTFLFLSLLLAVSFSYGQSLGLNGTGGAGGISNASFDQLKSNLGYKAANQSEKFRVDGTPFLFENWDQSAIITTKGGNKLRFKDVNFDGRRNKIVAKISKDSLYTFNSLAIEEAIINGRKFKNILDPNDGPVKIYEVLAETPEFSILKDHTVEISEGSSNPMRGSIYSRYITRENYFISNEKAIKKFKLNKKKVLALLGSKKESVANYVEENDLTFRSDEDLNKIFEYYSSL